jgi:hypothetical protein
MPYVRIAQGRYLARTGVVQEVTSGQGLVKVSSRSRQAQGNAEPFFGDGAKVVVALF